MRDLPGQVGCDVAASELADLRREVAELRQAVRARDDFIAIAAHELRNPMTPLLGVADLALAAARRAEETYPPRVTVLLERMQLLAQDFIQRSTRLLDVSRIEAGNLRLEPSATDLSALVLATVQKYEVAAARVRSPVEIGIQDGITGVWDRIAVEQVTENLLSNAIKFGAGKPVAVRLRSHGAAAWLDVQDRGIGMEPDQQARIFGRFEQVVAQHRGGGFASASGLPITWSRPWAAASPCRAARARARPSPSRSLSHHQARTGSRMTQHDPNAGGGEVEVERLRSLVPGLDAILCGGFLRGGLYMIQGPPGAGKTILASQIMFNHAAEGRRALFVTVLGENHGRMMVHLRPMRFFDAARIPDQVTYISAYRALDEEGLDGLAALIRHEVLSHRATLLVLDGMTAVEAKAGAGASSQSSDSPTNCRRWLRPPAAPCSCSPPRRA